MMLLAQPVWLLLLLPLAVVLWLWPAPSKLLQVWRTVTLGLIVLAMAAPMIRLPSRAGTVVVVADRSHSMPHDAAQQQLEVVNLIADGMTGQDRLGVVTFGYDTSIERAPDVGRLSEFVHEVAADGSDLSGALRKALSLVPEDGPARIVVLSDGRWTGVDPLTVAAQAASRAIPVDFREISRPAASDVAIDSFDAPLRTSPGESFMLSAWVRLPVSQTVRYELMRGNVRIAQGERDLPSGASRLLFRDTASDPGTNRYVLRVTGASDDPMPENNSAKTLVGVDGPRPILYLAQSSATSLPRLLTAGGLTVQPTDPAGVEWSLDTLSGYAGVFLENVPAEHVTERGMANLAQWVEQTGAGLVMTGGRQSYGPGGYFKSPLEPILPVSMELRQEHRKFSVAIAVALDRSGSMGASVGMGKTKMDLANLGTAQVVDLLSPMDELAVIAVDSSPHMIVPMGPVNNPAMVRGQVLHIQSMGGGIFVYEALQAAVAELEKATPQTKHVILFSDAMDSEEPGGYAALVDRCASRGMTFSVIGLGTERDIDAGLLKDIAKRGNGRVYFTTNPEELPRLFAQDTFVVARSSFVDETTPVRTTGGLVAVTGEAYEDPPAIGGYNLCYLRDEANLAAVTVDEYAAPLVATWQAGAGRVACYTGEADGEHTGAIARWSRLGDLFTSLARWTAGNDAPLPAGMVTRQRLDGGTYRIELHLDPERAELDLPQSPTVTTLRGRPGSTPSVHKATMHWSSPDVLSVEVPMRSDETALATLELPGLGPRTLTPVCLPYSPEFAPVREDRGVVSLEQLARATGGLQRIDLADVWRDLVRHPRLVPIAHWLLILAVTLFLLEVLERRTGALSMLRGARVRRATAATHEATPATTPARRKPARAAKPKAPPADMPQPAAQQKPAAPSAPPATPGLADALTRARRRADQRTRGHDRD